MVYRSHPQIWMAYRYLPLVLGMGIFGGAMYAHRLNAEPVGELVAREGMVVGDVVTTGDPISMPAAVSRGSSSP